MKIVIGGSYHKFLDDINKIHNKLEEKGHIIIAPLKDAKASKVNLEYDYILFQGEEEQDPVEVQQKFIDKINNAEKYVYFPLHLQPEMTTDTLGGIYYDQLLAIEKLRNILPDDWYIYVKENPKQTAYMRGLRFFERLSQIKNVRLLNKDVNTYDIMQDCQFVATITGTAGWEAITGGKPALVFGLALYRYLSGVSIYHDGITVKEILENNIDIVKLERQVYALKYTAYDFYNSCYQKELNTCYGYEDHCKNLYIALKKEIGL